MMTLRSSQFVRYTTFGMILVFGVAMNDLCSNRWSTAKAIEGSAKRVHDVPLEIGDWQGVDNEPMNERVLEVAGIIEYVSRRYTNQKTREVVQVMLVCGRPGPIAVHPPDICFRGAGYVFSSAPAKYRLQLINDESAEFKLSTPQKRESTYTNKLRVLWSWSASGEWLAPNMPRVTFVTHSLLYKVYIVSEFTSGRDQDVTISDGFTAELIPEINRALFAD